MQQVAMRKVDLTHQGLDRLQFPLQLQQAHHYFALRAWNIN
jgi:hypothetical protein